MKKASLLFAVLFSILLFQSVCAQPANAAVSTIVQSRSGLVVADPLNNETKTEQQLLADQQYWTYGGTAVSENASYGFYKDVQGLHIGVQAPSNGTYAGFYGVTPDTNAQLFHSVITTSYSTIGGGYFDNGAYVQTTSGRINYIACVSVTSSSGTVWEVLHTFSSPNRAVKFTVLWSDPSPNQPSTRDCTIITNGSNYLKVYMDNVMVYTSSKLNLQMPPPFNYFLEVENSYATMLYGSYQDYYATLGENIQVTSSAPNAATAKIVDSSGNVLAAAPIVSGVATVNVGMYHFPLPASVQICDSNNVVIASTSSAVNIYGGDVYSVN